MANEYYSILTTIGTERLAQALVTRIPLKLSVIAVGDGNGQYYGPTPDQTQLKRETWRGDVNDLRSFDDARDQVIAEGVIPWNAGGWTVREVGLFDETGALIAISNYADTIKPLPSSGSGKDLYVQVVIKVDNVAALELIVDGSTVLVSRDKVDSFIRGGGLYAGVFFASNELPYINLLMSNDGVRFGDPIRLTYNGAPMPGRDPAITRMGDYWVISITSYTAGSHDFGIYYSTDLINWNFKRCTMGSTAVSSNTKPAPGATVPATHIWAPEFLTVSDTDIYVFISIRANPDELDANGSLVKSFRPYYCKCTDINNFTFSAPILIDMQPGNKIDPDVFYDANLTKYIMVIKDEYDKKLEVHSANVFNGPYTYLTDIDAGEPVEGPSIIEVYGGKKRVYFDPFQSRAGIKYVETTDWQTFTTSQFADMPLMRHGSVQNVPLDGNDFYDFSKLAYTASSRAQVVNPLSFSKLADGVQKLTPVENTVYFVDASNVADVTITKGIANSFMLCIRSGSALAGIRLNGAVIANYTLGFGSHRDEIIAFEYDASTAKFRGVNFSNSITNSLAYIKLSPGQQTLAPEENTVYFVDASNVADVLIVKGVSSTVSFCVRSNSNLAAIRLSGAIPASFTIGFGKNKNQIINFEFDAPTFLYRAVNFGNTVSSTKLINSTGTSNVNPDGIYWWPDYAATYTTGGDDPQIVINDLPAENENGFYFNLIVQSATAGGSITLKRSSASNHMGSGNDVIISGLNGDDGRLYRVEKAANRWFVTR